MGKVQKFFLPMIFSFFCFCTFSDAYFGSAFHDFKKVLALLKWSPTKIVDTWFISKGLMISAFFPLLLLLLEHLFSLPEHLRLLLLGSRTTKVSPWSTRSHITSSNKVNRMKRRFESIRESYFEKRTKRFSSGQLGFWGCSRRANLIVGVA